MQNVSTRLAAHLFQLFFFFFLFQSLAHISAPVCPKMFQLAVASEKMKKQKWVYVCVVHRSMECEIRLDCVGHKDICSQRTLMQR